MLKLITSKKDVLVLIALMGVLAWACYIMVELGKTKIYVTLAEKRQVLTNSIGMRLVLIPAGTFVMGSPESEIGRRENEGPQHVVIIKRLFFMGTFEVTQMEFEAVMGTKPSWFSATGKGKDEIAGKDTSQFPVENITWEEANLFCLKLSNMPVERRCRRTYRLPTEAEWEYACRAGTKTPFCYGNSLSWKKANFDGYYPYGIGEKGPWRRRTCKVGLFKPNAFGLYDMHGNVSEMCADYFDPRYYIKSVQKDPNGPKRGDLDRRVGRGGSWAGGSRFCRSACRYGIVPDVCYHSIGFRVVCVIGNAAKAP